MTPEPNPEDGPMLFEGKDEVMVFDLIEDWFRDHGNEWVLAGLNVDRNEPGLVRVSVITRRGRR